MKLIFFSAILVFFLSLAEAAPKCRNPSGRLGDTYVDGCTRYKCSKARGRALKWTSSTAMDVCCFQAGQWYPADSTIGEITSEDNCVEVTITCEEGARISGHIKKNCLSDIREGIEDILDYLGNGVPQPSSVPEGTTIFPESWTFDNHRWSSSVAPGGAGGGSGGGSVPSNAEFCAMSLDHTMCKYEGPSAECSSKTQFRELSAATKQAILDKHNELRRKVAKGQEAGQPEASNMRKLVWNDELEAVAQRWSDQCDFGHDSDRGKLDGTSVGQNVFLSYKSAPQTEAQVQDPANINQATQNWYDEVTTPGFNSADISPFVFDYGAGHYTQVVWADTEELGCGMVYYQGREWYETLIVCNYAVTGNLIGATMYETGTACSNCPSGYTCDDGLCSKA